MMAFSTNIHAQGMDPQAMIQRQVDRMTTELSLSKDQVAKIEPLIEARMNKMMELREQGMEREEMMAEMNKPKPKRKVIKKPKPRIIYGLNTNSM
jgi:Mg2+ and Co2+ transporter CorA